MPDKVTNTLAENCTLVRLTCKHPSGIKRDKDLSTEMAESKQVSNPALIKAQKHIYGHDINKNFRRILDKFRYDYYLPMTFPWSDSSNDDFGHKVQGWRLCPNTHLERLSTAKTKAERDWDKEVESFLRAYDTIVAGAVRILGDAYRAEDYPATNDLRPKFKFDFEIKLIPTMRSDIRLNVSEELRKRIENDAINRANNNIKQILVTTTEALVEQVDHVSSKLDGYDPSKKRDSSFSKASFGKLRKAVTALPVVNDSILGNNAVIKIAHENLVSALAKIDSLEELRGDSQDADDKRKKVAQSLTDSVDDLKGSFLAQAMGGKNDGTD
jgi:hypothetical protein